MRIQMVLMAAAGLCLVACGKQPPPAEETPATTDEISEAVEEAGEQRAQRAAVIDPALVEHMHEHADRMDELMFALDDGDLESAQKAAAWLGGHQSPDGLPAEWQPYLAGMREAATSVELAPDLASARTAAEQISGHCQSCHAAAGIVTPE